MASSNLSSNSPSRTSTPNPRFTPSTPTTEDLLKPQSGGLVQLSDFRKRRAEALEHKDREASQGGSFGRFHPALNGNASITATASDG
jgi:protein FAM50